MTQTPASVEIQCIGLTCESAQAVADMAQKHCQQFGLDAREASVSRSASGNEWARYDCVNNSGVSPARPNP